MLLGGRKLTAIEAYQIGLVSQVFWPTSMMQEVIPRIQNMASFSSRVRCVNVHLVSCYWNRILCIKTQSAVLDAYSYASHTCNNYFLGPGTVQAADAQLNQS